MLPFRVKIEEITGRRNRVEWEKREYLIKDARPPTRKTTKESHSLS